MHMRKKYFQKLSSFRGCGFIGMQGVWKENGQDVTIVNVYWSCDLMLKRRLWRELICHRRWSNNNLWCVLDDFNLVRFASESNGEARMEGEERKRKDFNKFIEDMKVIDVPMVGKRYTWFRPNEKCMSRIYRIFVSPMEWMLSICHG